MKISRNEFLKASLTFLGATASAAAFGCGTDEKVDDTAAGPPAPSGAGGSGTSSSSGETSWRVRPLAGSQGATEQWQVGTIRPPRGSSTTTTGSGQPMDPSCDATVTVVADHTHTVEVPLADVSSGDTVTYPTSFDAGHSHEVTLTKADFTKLGTAKSISTDTTCVDGHVHTVTVVCAST